MASRSKTEKRVAARVQRERPAVPLYPYQKAWVQDESRFKIAVKARQIGWTFGAALRVAIRRVKKRGTTIWISASERQSREAIEYIKLHLEAMGRKFTAEEVEFPGVDAKIQLIKIDNGSRIFAMPANPDTVRGFAGDVVLDEKAFHRDAVKIWRAALAIASRGHQVEVISTPNGAQGKFYELARKAGLLSPSPAQRQAGCWQAGIWSAHWCDIHKAVAQGCPVNVSELREAADDEDSWLQEEECVFLADAENYIPMELVVSCESEAASLELPASFAAQGQLYLGVDIGRKKDRTVLWLLEKLGDVAWTRQVEVLPRTPFKVQFSLIDALMPGVTRACVDATGLGMQLAEDLQAKWGAKVEPVEFQLANKESMATNIRRQFEERLVRIPPAAFIRRSINAVKRFTSPTGHFRFDADRTEQGHADEFWALALALAAASGPALSTELHRVGADTVAAQLGRDFGYGGAGSASLAAQGF